MNTNLLLIRIGISRSFREHNKEPEGEKVSYAFNTSIKIHFYTRGRKKTTLIFCGTKFFNRERTYFTSYTLPTRSVMTENVLSFRALCSAKTKFYCAFRPLAPILETISKIILNESHSLF